MHRVAGASAARDVYNSWMAPKRRLTAVVASMLAAIGLLKALGWARQSVAMEQLQQRLNDWSDSPAHSWASHLVARGLPQLLNQAGIAYVLALVPAILLVSAGLVVRTYAHACLREGRPDPLSRVRRVLAHTWLARGLAWLPGLAWATVVASTHGRWLATSAWLWGGQVVHPWAFVVAAALACGTVACALHALAARGLRALVAPLDHHVATPAPAKEAGDITFWAVAVTRFTRGAVGAMAVGSIAMVAWAALAPLDGPRAFGAILAYAAAATVAALAFRRAARIVIGIDGVRVRDAFYAYRDLDDVRAHGAELELLSGGRRVLRLQMHSDDVGRRDEVIARVRDALERRANERTRGATMLVNARTAAQVASRATYREPTVSRDQLWELVEGSCADGPTRVAAAEALAVALPSSERSRLRVAAGQCAEPRARVALAALVEEFPDGDEALAATPTMPRTRALPGPGERTARERH
jgi:hypothetical protein